MTETRTDPEIAAREAAAELEAARPPADPEALRAEIEVTRAQLADTVAALAAKTNVKSRVRGSVSMVSGQVRNRVHGAAGHVRESIGGVGDRMSAATHPMHRGGHRAGRDHLPVAPETLESATPTPPPWDLDASEPAGVEPAFRPDIRHRPPTLAAGAIAGALVGFLVYLLWRGRR
ncbi:MAG TPA: DUF3618 domain-containing protein [Micromonosporaceae bacterium]|nr:DUF3618 domain-containing protein [Micromonosporaceae bacterium]